MTLGEALRALQDTERIRCGYLPGMRWTRARHDPPEWLRIALQAPSGPSWITVDPDDGTVDWSSHPVDGWPWDAEPDLTDPATVGCLLALLREAERDPGACTVAPSPAGGEGRWYVHLPIEGSWATDLGAPTEGEAIAAALVALAEALR